MTLYIVKLLILLPLVAAMAWGALWLWRRAQPGMALGQREKMVRVVDALPMGTSGRLAVVEFAGKNFLVAVSRSGINLIAEGDAASFTKTLAKASAHE